MSSPTSPSAPLVIRRRQPAETQPLSARPAHIAVASKGVTLDVSQASTTFLGASSAGHALGASDASSLPSNAASLQLAPTPGTSLQGSEWLTPGAASTNADSTIDDAMMAAAAGVADLTPDNSGAHSLNTAQSMAPTALNVSDEQLKPTTRITTRSPDGVITCSIAVVNLLVAGLRPSVDDRQLRELFEPFGELQSALVMLDVNTGKSRGFGFVRFYRQNDADRAVKEMHLAKGASGERRLRVVASIHNDGRVDESNLIFCRNVPQALSQPEALAVFARVGDVVELSLEDDESVVGKGRREFQIATVKYVDIDTARQAVHLLHGAKTLTMALPDGAPTTLLPSTVSLALPLLVKYAERSEARKAKQDALAGASGEQQRLRTAYEASVRLKTTKTAQAMQPPMPMAPPPFMAGATPGMMPQGMMPPGMMPPGMMQQGMMPPPTAAMMAYQQQLQQQASLQQQLYTSNLMMLIAAQQLGLAPPPPGMMPPMQHAAPMMAPTPMPPQQPGFPPNLPPPTLSMPGMASMMHPPQRPM
jgi:hypothetical protein